MMANPRRNSLANTNNNQSSIFVNQTSTPTHANSTSSRIIHFLKKPHAFPFLLSVFLFLTWLSLKLQHTNSRFSPPTLARAQQTLNHHAYEDDAKAGLVRFPSGFPSPLAKDTRGWMLDPISLALTHHLSGGAVTCASLHLGEIRPGALRGNHRHHTCNETLVIWGAKTKYREAELIKSIPLAQAETEDTLFWPWTTDGFYTCKSGYRFLKEENELRHSVEDEQGKHFWKEIWSLHLPNKVKKFLWRACRNSLPTKQNLVRRTVITDPHCDRCCVAAECTLYALWSCSMLDSVWVATDFWSCRSSMQFLDFRELLGWIMQ